VQGKLKVYNKCADIAGVILAGGQSSRMGGGDKSLKLLGSKTILEHVIERLSPQVTTIVLNANGDPQRFTRFGTPVIQDQTDGFLGPLAGVLSGLEWAEKNGFQRIITVAADTPFFPKTLVSDLCTAVSKSSVPIALAATQPLGMLKINRHPTFGVWPVSLRNNLKDSLNVGIRKVVIWTELHGHIDVLFESGANDPFFNVNTYDDLNLAKQRINLEV
jgi:molybdopterin-guanine dinucleotide biosynthesis protein A